MAKPNSNERIASSQITPSSLHYIKLQFGGQRGEHSVGPAPLVDPLIAAAHRVIGITQDREKYATRSDNRRWRQAWCLSGLRLRYINC
jgi:hypothetical protein